MKTPAMWNGAAQALTDVRIPALDRGFLFGDGVYEVVRAYGGKLWLWDEHEARLRRSLDGLGIAPPPAGLRARCEALLGSLPAPRDAGVYIQVTRGAPTRRSHVAETDTPPNELLFSEPLAPDFGKAKAEGGIAVRTWPDQRWGRCDLKTVNLLGNVLAAMQAKSAGADEAALVDRDGLVTEGTHSSVFFVKEGVLKTAPLTMNVLPSITRAWLLGAAERLGMTVHEEAVRADEALGCEEAFFCGTLSEVQPVVRWNGETFGGGKPGAVTRRLQGALAVAVGSS